MLKCKTELCNNSVEPPKTICNECKVKASSERYKVWAAKNKEKRSQYGKEYRQKNKEEASNYHKQYRQKNKDKLDAYMEQWYQDNLERERLKEAIYSRKPERRFYVVQRSAHKRGISFLLTYDQYLGLIELPCHYCNNRLCEPVEAGGGLDRLDNSRGYEIDNVVSCGKVCNHIKMDCLTEQETKAAVAAILKVRYPNDNGTRN